MKTKESATSTAELHRLLLAALKESERLAAVPVRPSLRMVEQQIIGALRLLARYRGSRAVSGSSVDGADEPDE